MFAQNDLVPEIIKLQKFAFRLTRNKSDADDLVQSTCLRALEKADYFENGTNLFSWTSKIMYNLFVTGYRRKVKFESQYDPEIYIEKQTVRPEQDTHMELADVQSAINKLSPDRRNILVLICVEGRRYKEVAQILDVPIGTVRSRLFRAREQLQDNLDKKYIPAYLADHVLKQRA